MVHKGSCHCGRIAFEVTGEPTLLIECNCSICSKKGALIWMVPSSDFRLLTPQTDLATYTFNRHHIQHRYCPVCGMHPYGEANAPDGAGRIAVNARCLDDLEIAALPVKPFDGRAL